MECTKGKLRAEGWLIVKDTKTPRLRYAVAETNCCDGISDKESTANAKELVRRWNAFEKDGLVDELVRACKMGLNATRGILNINELMDGSAENKDRLKAHIKQIEATIARAQT